MKVVVVMKVEGRGSGDRESSRGASVPVRRAPRKNVKNDQQNRSIDVQI
jgi:hypothetical protein